MTTFIEYEIEDGMKLLIETSENITGGVIRASRDGNKIIESQKKFGEAFKSAMLQAKILVKEINELLISEAEIKFGLSTIGEVGNIAVGKIGLGVNYEVTLKWKKLENK